MKNESDKKVRGWETKSQVKGAEAYPDNALRGGSGGRAERGFGPGTVGKAGSPTCPLLVQCPLRQALVCLWAWIPTDMLLSLRL